MTTPVELPIAAPAASTAGSAGVSRAQWLRLARWLSWASLAYMAVEGAVALAAGLVAGSIVLVGFGIDSAIEGFASLVIVWRFAGSRLHSDHAEQRAQRLVAIQFFLLAPPGVEMRGWVADEELERLYRGARFVGGRAAPEGVGIRIAERVLEADHVVWACGPWLAKLFPEIVELRV